MENNISIHLFENAGLGKAPFRCVSFIQLPSVSLAEHNPSGYNNAMNNATQIAKGYNIKLGSCDYCGMALMNHFVIKSADKKFFTVGCECVRKTNDSGLRDKVKLLQRQKAKAEREKKRQEKHKIAMAEREAKEEQERIKNGGLTNYELNQIHQKAIDFDKFLSVQPYNEFIYPVLEEKAEYSGFCDSILHDLKAGKKISDLPQRALDIISDIYAKSYGRRNSKKYNDAYDDFWEKIKAI